MKQKLFTMLLCLIVGIGSVNAADIASGSFKNGGTWKISDKGELYIDAVTVPDYKAKVDYSPSQIYVTEQTTSDIYGNTTTYYSYNTTFEITPCHSTPWYAYSSYITSVRFSSSVTYIGKYAFAGLWWIKKVTFDNRTSTVTIGEMAFANISKLETFDFTYVSSIGERAFVGCSNLKSNSFPAITYTGYEAFYLCYKLYEKGVVQLGNNVSVNADVIKGFECIAEGCKKGVKLKHTTSNNGIYYTNVVKANSSFRIIVPVSKYSSFQSQFGNLPFPAYSNCRWLKGNDEWYLNEYGVLTICKATGDFASPSDAPWYSLRNEIKQVYYEGTRTVGKNSFKGYTNLTSINSMLHTVGVSAFEGCTNLKTADLSEVTTIGADAFANTQLGSVSLNAATLISSNAFDGAPLVYLSLGADLTTIGSQAFRNTTLHTVIVAGEAPTTPRNAFENVTAANVKLYVPANVANTYEVAPWNSFTFDRRIDKFPVEDSLLDPMWRLFSDGDLMICKDIPDYTSEQDQPWYNYREFISRIIIRSNVTYIGNYAFAFSTSGVSKIKEIEADYSSSITLGAHALENNDQLTKVSLKRLVSIGDEAFSGCTQLKNYTFDSNLQSIGSKAFNGCPIEATISLSAPTPPTVSSTTFQGMGVTAASAPGRNGVKTSATGQKAVSLDVPESSVVTYANTPYWNLFSMEYIGEHGSIEAGDVFGNGMWILYADSTLIVSCSSLETGSGLQDQTTLHDWGTNAGKIKRIEVLGELPELYRSFNDLPNLESVSFSSSVKKLYSTFRNCPKLKDVPLNSVEEFREYGNLGCFEQCTSLTDVKLDNARIIGFRCFAECTALKTVEFPRVDTIENVAFVNCPALESVTVSDAYIGNAFRGCTGLKEVTLNGVNGHVIPSEAFKGCTALETVRINGSLHSVENDAFNGTALTDIYLSSPYPATVANRYNSNVFSGLTLSDITLHVPADFVNRYSATYNNPVWSQMNVVADEDYAEDLIPVSGPLGSNGTWELGSDQKLTINCNGAMPTAQAATGQDSYSDTWYDWMPYVAHIEFTKTTTSVASNAFGLYLGDNNFASVGAITLGAGMQQIDDRGLFLKFQNGGDVYCYAENPPMLNGSNCFNWSEITGKNVTLHVLTKNGVLAQYRNAAGWQNFPNIVADLGPRYKVSWDADNGYIKVDESGIDLKAVPEGTTIHLTAVPYYGYWLKQWNNYNPATGLTVTSDISVSAEFTTNYIVSFYTPSEIFAGQYTLLKRDTVEAGNAATAPADPVREGYRFMGWDRSFDNIVKQTAVYAQFEPIVYAESVKMSPEVKSVQVPSAELGTKTFQCYATVSPGNADNNAVTWSSDDESVATVDANGLVTILDYGAATITATTADGSDISGKCVLGVFSTDFMPIIQGTAIAVEGGVTEITMTKSQSAKLVNLVVTPEDYNGGISVIHHGPLQVNPCGEGEKTLPAFFIKPEMASTYPYDDTITFHMNDYDHQAVNSMPQCQLIVHVTDDALFTAKTIEGVDMTFRITDPMKLTCEVYGYMEQLMEPDPVTGLPFVMHPAIDAATAGKITVPAVVRGCMVENISSQAFAGCSALTEIELENGIMYINMAAFQECSALQKMILPKSIKGLSMLGGMPQLANVYMYNPEPPIGWEIAENGENMMPDIAMTNAFQMIASNATLHVARGSLSAYNKAPWTTWFATVTDDMDAVFAVRFIDWDDSEIEVQNVDYGAAAKAVQGLTREGHEFTGWDKDFSRITANLTVKAQYSILSYNVTFLNWDGTQLGAVQSVTYGSAAVAPAVPARNGYVFAGWSADFSNVTGDMTIKAMYAKEGQYLVTFTDWDNSTLKCEIVDAGGSATAPEDPVREGYIFTGWSGSYTNVNADLTIQALYNDATGIEEIFSQPDASAAVKILHDGTLYILRPDGTVFNAQGVRVK